MRRAIHTDLHAMNTYQLILQFRGASYQNFTRLDDLENRLTAALEASESFDGFDVAAHGANVFIYTSSPDGTFQRLRPIFDHAESESGFTVAYRTVAGEKFQTIWPADSTAAFSLR